MAIAIILNQQCACLHPGYHRPGGTSMMACGNIIKKDDDFGAVESQKRPLLPLAISYPMPFICVSSCQKLKKVNGATKYKVAGAHNPDRATAILGLRHCVFMDQFIFRHNLGHLFPRK